MERPRLVLVTGGPGSGKTTLVARLGTAIGLPVLSRDRLKALLADALDPPANADRAMLRHVHVRLFFGLLVELLASGPGLIAESALDRRLAPEDLAPALARADAVIVHCDLVHEVAVHRFAARARRGERHRVHDDAAHLARLADDPAAWNPYREPPPLDVPILRVDTSSGYRPDLAAIAAFVSAPIRA